MNSKQPATNISQSQSVLLPDRKLNRLATLALYGTIGRISVTHYYSLVFQENRTIRMYVALHDSSRRKQRTAFMGVPETAYVATVLTRIFKDWLIVDPESHDVRANVLRTSLLTIHPPTAHQVVAGIQFVTELHKQVSQEHGEHSVPL